MIVICDGVYKTFEETQPIIDELRENSYKKEDFEVVRIFTELLTDVFAANDRLEEMAEEKFSGKYYVFIKIPLSDTELLDSFGYMILPKNKEDKVKKRDEILFKELFDICFGHIDSYFYRLVKFFDPEQ